MSNPFAWNKNYDSQLLLRTISKFRTVKDNKASYDALQYEFWLPVLKSAISANGAVGSLKARCVERALSDGTLSLNDPQQFLEKCDEKFRDLLRAPRKQFVLFCEITYDGPRLINQVLEGGNRIHWPPKHGSPLLRAIRKARSNVPELFERFKVKQRTPGLSPLLVHVEAIDSVHAYNDAIDAIDRFRGLLNLLVNSRRTVNPFRAINQKPFHAINRFRLGPSQTVHNSDGTLAAEIIWYEPRWFHENKPVKFSGPTSATRKSIQRWWKKSMDTPLHEHIGEGLIRYCRALDRHESDVALLGLWGTLEKLMGTVRYDLTVARTVRLFRDDGIARLVAEHVRGRRNGTVHSASAPDQDEAEAVLIHASMLAGEAISFCIRKGNSFRSTEELFDFLDLGLDLGKVKRERALIDHYVKFRTHWDQAAKKRRP